MLGLRQLSFMVWVQVLGLCQPSFGVWGLDFRLVAALTYHMDLLPWDWGLRLW